MPLRFDILTLFPGFFTGPLDYGVLQRAIANGLCEVHRHDLRDWTHDKHRTVDDRPFGGGEGMVLKPEPLFEAVESLGVAPLANRDTARETVILLSAQGRKFDQAMAQQLAQTQRIVLICGRYEGVDERVAEALADREVSVGDFVLSGGEIAAALMIDAIARLLPGALGNSESSRQESFGAHESQLNPGAHQPGDVPRAVHGAGGLLDYPHYTRPADFRGMAVPSVLTQGDHKFVRMWRRRKQLEKTLRNRPDLLRRAQLSEEDKAELEKLARATMPLADFKALSLLHGTRVRMLFNDGQELVAMLDHVSTDFDESRHLVYDHVEWSKLPHPKEGCFYAEGEYLVKCTAEPGISFD